MKGFLALVVIVVFLLLIVGAANELQLKKTPTPAPTKVPVLALVGEAATQASEVRICNSAFLFVGAILFGTFCMYHWLNNDD